MLSSASALQLQVHPRAGLAGLATDLSAPLMGIFTGDAEISTSEAGFTLIMGLNWWEDVISWTELPSARRADAPP